MARAYVRGGRRRLQQFQDLLTAIREKNAYFGHIGLPGMQEQEMFRDAVFTSGISRHEISSSLLVHWYDMPEGLRKRCRNNSEARYDWGYEDADHESFKYGWNFESAFAQGGAGSVDEEVAPDEMGPETETETHGTHETSRARL